MAIDKYFEISPLPSCWSRGALPTSGFGCFGRFGKKHFGAPDGLALACWHSETSSGGAQSVQRSRGFCMSLRSSEAIQSDGLSSVLRNTSTVLKHEAQVALSCCMPLCRCKAPESHSLHFVLRNTQTLIVAHSNYKLPEAAAALLRNCFDCMRRVLGPDHPQTILCRRWMEHLGIEQ